jgi:predicted PurR-regulated permease PerM
VNLPLALLLVAVTAAFGWILLPFFGAILWAAIIALLFAPLYRSMVMRLRGRATLAALITLGIVVVMVILPMALIAASMASEAASLVQGL